MAVAESIEFPNDLTNSGLVDAIVPLAQSQPLVNVITMCGQDENATFGQVRLEILNCPQGFPFRQVGHERTDPYQVERRIDGLGKADVKLSRLYAKNRIAAAHRLEILIDAENVGLRKFDA